MSSTPALSGSPSIGALSVSALDSADLARHRWYFFKEAFSPEIVSTAIEDAKCGAEDLIFDPFCGSGTVPLQAALHGCRAEGIEVNPFLAFVARSKLRQCSSATLRKHIDLVMKAAKRGRRSSLSGFSTFTENGEDSKWLFNDEVLSAFEGAWHSDGAVGPSAASLLVRLCLIGAAMDSCNAEKDGKCLRYRKGWKKRAFSRKDFLESFEQRSDSVADDLKSTPLASPQATILTADARQQTPNRFRLCITSPPYLNSFDYTDVYRPELFLGKWVDNMQRLRQLRRRTLRSHVQVSWDEPTYDDFGVNYEQTLDAIKVNGTQLWNSRIPKMIQAYFEDMRTVLTNLRAGAAKGASTWIVVSTSAYGGVEIPVDLILAEIGVACGWHLREVSVLRYLRRVACQQWNELARQKEAGPHLRESLIIFDSEPIRGATVGQGNCKFGSRRGPSK